MEEQINKVKCSKCNTLMTKTKTTGVRVKLAANKVPVKFFTTKESSELIPYVCSNCGYVEWYVEQPENFKI